MEALNIDNKLVINNTFYYPDGGTYVKTDTFDKLFLENQKVAITKQRDEMVKIKEAELVEVETLLAKCVELGVIIPVVQPTVETIEPTVDNVI